MATYFTIPPYEDPSLSQLIEFVGLQGCRAFEEDYSIARSHKEYEKRLESSGWLENPESLIQRHIAKGKSAREVWDEIIVEHSTLLDLKYPQLTVDEISDNLKRACLCISRDVLSSSCTLLGNQSPTLALPQEMNLKKEIPKHFFLEPDFYLIPIVNAACYLGSKNWTAGYWYNICTPQSFIRTHYPTDIEAGGYLHDDPAYEYYDNVVSHIAALVGEYKNQSDDYATASTILRRHLQEGVVTVYGLEHGEGELKPVPWIFWGVGEIDPTCNRSYFFEKTNAQGHTWQQLRFLKKDVVAIWPTDNRKQKPEASYKEIELWYKEKWILDWKRFARHLHVKSHPSEKDDYLTARQIFGNSVGRDVMRELRRKYAPENWKSPGRRPTIA